MQLSKEYFIYQLQITWSRLEDDVRPYSLLTIGDQNYIEDKRFLVATPLRGLTNVSIFLCIGLIATIKNGSSPGLNLLVL